MDKIRTFELPGIHLRPFTALKSGSPGMGTSADSSILVVDVDEGRYERMVIGSDVNAMQMDGRREVDSGQRSLGRWIKSLKKNSLKIDDHVIKVRNGPRVTR
jgi:hypothetical protein